MLLLYIDMYLKKLELNGFKSFAKFSTLEFSPGVTAVVGPNGSGKSNIADAVRWILGEQSLKSIRSKNSRDLIFSGSKSKSRLSKASVALYFDNQKGSIPLDYSEVMISRTIFRDGASEYLINKNSTKLMDVVEILAKANIGCRGFSVINQGMESEILRYSSKELYELLEEASGVRYLQLKKKRAESRVKSTQNNIEKAFSVLKEIVPHLKYLKKEATKIQRKEKLEQKLTKARKQFFLLSIDKIEKQRNKLTDQKQKLDIKIIKLKQEINQLEQEFKKEEANIYNSRKQFSESQKELEEILDKRGILSEKLANLRAQVQMERQIQPTNQNQEGIKINLLQAEKEFQDIHFALKKLTKLNNLTQIKQEIDNILSRVEKIIKTPINVANIERPNSEKLNKFLKQQVNLEKDLNLISQNYEEQKQIMKNSQNQLSQEKFFEIERKLRKRKDDLSELESQLKEIIWSAEHLNDDFTQLKEEINRADMNYKELKKEISTAKEQENEPIEELKEKINRLKYKVEEIGGVDELTIKEYEETQERYDKLSKKLKDLKKAKKDLEELIKKLTKEIRNKFDKNFQVINNNFNKYFRLLFNGGKVYLKQIEKILPENEENEEENYYKEELVTKGIEIKATLPGKKIKNLRMFSGGEKALTSIALLFAIVSSNPPPFLVLDEADATLDEGNSQRFAKLIKEFSKNTQFIVITHNRETMKQADVLYGVTMGQDGVSSLLSLKFEK